MSIDSSQPPAHEGAPETIEMPAPTVWPMVFACGVCLFAAGFITNLVFTAVGAVLFLLAWAGWIQHLVTSKGIIHEEFVPPEQRPRPVVTHAGAVEELRMGMPGHRMRVPEKVHPYTAGLKGGIIGGIAMTVVPLGYGLLSRHGLWYPINLLAGMLLPEFGQKTTRELEEFSREGLLIGIFIHAVMSMGLGLIYGVLLPMLPNRPLRLGGVVVLPSPVLWGGLVAPLLWSGINYGLMKIINPLMYYKVRWLWFLASQVVYGLVVGWVVVRSEQVYVEQYGPGARPDEPPMGFPPEGRQGEGQS